MVFSKIWRKKLKKIRNDYVVTEERLILSPLKCKRLKGMTESGSVLGKLSQVRLLG